MRFELQDHMRARYEVLGPLGYEGTGVVSKAHDRQLDRVVALKCLAAGAEESAPARCWRGSASICGEPRIWRPDDRRDRTVT